MTLGQLKKALAAIPEGAQVLIREHDTDWYSPAIFTYRAILRRADGTVLNHDETAYGEGNPIEMVVVVS